MTAQDEALRLLDMEDVMQLLGAQKRWLYEQMRLGRLPAAKIAGKWKVRRIDLDAFIQSRIRPSGERPKL